ncbi:DUF2892 domain-containing protein [Knoellia locipacati]|uniref:YgaP family membrane protein n=1 Tax=Knoellia locipacati TaxID=882824 RepID=UPI00384C2669
MGIDRPSVNITPTERIARVVLGATAVVAGVWLLQDASSVTASILKVLVGLAGFDLVVTGATGHCPLYKMLGHVPALPKGRGSTAPDGDRHRVDWHDDTPTVKPTSDYLTDEPDGQPAGESHSHGEDHAQMLLACSTLMLFIVSAFVGTGVWGAGAIAYALLGVAMMAAMMLPMPGHRD